MSKFKEIYKALVGFTDADLILVLRKRDDIKDKLSDDEKRHKRDLISNITAISTGLGISDKRANIEKVLQIRQIMGEISDADLRSALSRRDSDPDLVKDILDRFSVKIDTLELLLDLRETQRQEQQQQPLLTDIPVELCMRFIGWSDRDYDLVFLSKEQTKPANKSDRNRLIRTAQESLNKFGIQTRQKLYLELIREINNIFASCRTIDRNNSKKVKELLDTMKRHAAKHRIAGLTSSDVEQLYHYCNRLTRRKSYSCKNLDLISGDDVAQADDDDLVMTEKGFCFTREELLYLAREHQGFDVENPWNRQLMANDYIDIIDPKGERYTVKRFMETLLRDNPEPVHRDLRDVHDRSELIRELLKHFNNLFNRMQTDRFLTESDIVDYIDNNRIRSVPGHIQLLKTLSDHIKIGIDRFDLGSRDQREEFFAKINPLFKTLDDLDELKDLPIDRETALKRSIFILEEFTILVNNLVHKDDSSVLQILSRVYDMIKARVLILYSTILLCLNYFLLTMRYDPASNVFRFYMRRQGVETPLDASEWDERIWEEERC